MSDSDARARTLRLDFLLTALTLAGTVAGFVAEARGSTPGIWLCFGTAFLAGGVPAARTALVELVADRKLDVDLLMVVAALGAASVGEAGDGAILLFLFSLSNALQDWAFTRTRDAIHALMELSPEGATVEAADGSHTFRSLEEIRPGDVVLVRPGERFPADGAVLSGYTSVDESALTGESTPVEKEPRSAVFSGTLNGQGVVRARVERPASESTLAQLVRLVEKAQAEKSPTEQFAARLEGPYSMVVLASAPLVFAVLYFLFQFTPGDAWYRAMTFLVVASPCAVVISTPAAVLSAMAAGARAGTLFKSGAALEALAATRIVALDKTGTLTRGEMRLVEVRAFDMPEGEARALAAGLERHSEHPIARAVASAWSGPAPEVADVQGVRGKGVRGQLDGATVWAGTRRMAEEAGALVTAEHDTLLTAWERRGVTTLLLGCERQVLAALAVADTERPEAAEAVRLLRARGLRVVMLSGDRADVARHIAADLGIEEVMAPLLPEEKLTAIEALRREGRVLMVGDGVNDAPAMAGADVGMAMGTGSDVSLESADVVLMKDDLRRIAGAWDLARSAAATIRFNLSFALGIIVVVGVLALAGKVPLPLGVVAHEGGTLFVVAVGLRLLLHRVGRGADAADAAADTPSEGGEAKADAKVAAAA